MRLIGYMPKFTRFMFFGLIIIGLTLAPDSAQAEKSLDKKKLKQVEQEIKQRNKNKQKLERKADKLAKQQKELQQKIIFLAARIQNSDLHQREIENDIDILSFSEADMLKRLQKDRDKLAASLAALQRFEKELPPATAVYPDDALAGLRGGMAIAGIVPTLQQAARKIKAQLEELSAIRTQMRDNQARLKTEAELAEQDKIHLAQLIADKKKTEVNTRSSIAEEKREIDKLARQARSLRDLVKKLEARRPTKRDSVNFRASKGRLPLPVSGKFFTPRQAAKRNADLGREGSYIQARANAVVTVPFDANVQYAGSFRDYGTILIMSVGRNYHLVIAGLDVLDVEVGQDVLAGEPLGRMAGATYESQNLLHSSVLHSSVLHPRLLQETLTLYIEIRYKGQPISSSGWFKKP